MSLSPQCKTRLASETVEESDAYLQQISLSQQSRLASETAEEREAKQDGESVFSVVMQPECTCPAEHMVVHSIHIGCVLLDFFS